MHALATHTKKNKNFDTTDLHVMTGYCICVSCLSCDLMEFYVHQFYVFLQLNRENQAGLLPCNGIDVNARTSSGMVPLHSAVSGRHLGVVEQLLSCKHKWYVLINKSTTLDYLSSSSFNMNFKNSE